MTATTSEVVCIFGSRPKWWPDPTEAHAFTMRIVAEEVPRGAKVITGGAPGVDRWAYNHAEALGHEVAYDLAEWTKPDGTFDRQGGHKRNARLAYDCTRAIGIIAPGGSPGSNSMVRFLRSMMKPYVLHYPQGE